MPAGTTSAPLTRADAAEPAEQVEPPAVVRVPRFRLRVGVGIAGLVAAAVLLRVERLPTWYWIDEALSVGIAGQSLHEIPGVLVQDGNPPLYYLLLGGWIRVFGDGEVATHALSLLLAVAVVPVAWWAARRLFDPRAGWYAAAFAAISPFLTYFAGETRMYSLVVLESLLVATAFVLAYVHRRRGTVGWFAVAVIALIYTHTWGLYTVLGAALAGAGLLVLADDRPRLLRDLAWGFGIPALAFLPWVPTLLAQLSSTGAPWAYTPGVRGFVREVAALLGDERVLIALGLAAGAGLLPAITCWRDRDALAMLSIAVVGVVPAGLGWVVAHVEPSWATRYLAVVVGPMILLVGVGLGRAGGLGLAGFAVAALLTVQPFTRIGPGLDLPRDAKSNAHAVAEQIDEALPAGSTVLVDQPEAVPLFAHYLGEDHRWVDPRGEPADPTVMDWRDAHEELTARGGEVIGLVLADLLPGERIALINHDREPRPTDTDWIHTFRAIGDGWRQALEDQPCLRLVESIGSAARPAAPSSETPAGTEPGAPAAPGPETPYEAHVYECE